MNYQKDNETSSNNPGFLAKNKFPVNQQHFVTGSSGRLHAQDQRLQGAERHSVQVLRLKHYFANIFLNLLKLSLSLQSFKKHGVESCSQDWFVVVVLVFHSRTSQWWMIFFRNKNLIILIKILSFISINILNRYSSFYVIYLYKKVQHVFLSRVPSPDSNRSTNQQLNVWNRSSDSEISALAMASIMEAFDPSIVSVAGGESYPSKKTSKAQTAPMFARGDSIEAMGTTTVVPRPLSFHPLQASRSFSTLLRWSHCIIR